MIPEGGRSFGVSLPVGDPRRAVIRRAVLVTFLTAGAFFFTVPLKEIKTLYQHAPWLNDPYDTLYSFAMFFVPLVAVFFMVQVSICKKFGPLPVQRVRSILRGARVCAALITATLVSCWTSIALKANHPNWNADTGFLVAGLIAVTTMDAFALVSLGRVRHLPSSADDPQQDDWLKDAVIAVSQQSHWLGPLQPLAKEMVDWGDRAIARRLRQHPIVAALVASLVFGLGVGANQSFREGYSLAPAFLTMSLLACGAFAFFMTAGAGLGFVRSQSALTGAKRIMVDAGVVACCAALAVLAFRNSLWWIVGSSVRAAGTGQLSELIGLAMASAFAAAMACESILRLHALRPEPGTG